MGVDGGGRAVASERPGGVRRLATAQLPEEPALLAERAGLVARAVGGDLGGRFD